MMFNGDLMVTLRWGFAGGSLKQFLPARIQQEMDFASQDIIMLISLPKGDLKNDW